MTEERHKKVLELMLSDVIKHWEKIKEEDKPSLISFLRSLADDYEYGIARGGFDFFYKPLTPYWCFHVLRDGWYAREDLMGNLFEEWGPNMLNFCQLLRETADTMDNERDI